MSFGKIYISFPHEIRADIFPSSNNLTSRSKFMQMSQLGGVVAGVVKLRIRSHSSR